MSESRGFWADEGSSVLLFNGEPLVDRGARRAALAALAASVAALVLAACALVATVVAAGGDP